MTSPTTDDILGDFPMPKPAGCPFAPPAPLTDVQRREGGKPVRVRIMDGSTPWVVTKFAQQRKLLADPRISAEATEPGYPIGFPISKEIQEAVGFILMDGPEHARQRRMVTGPFTVRRIEAMRPFVTEVVEAQIRHLLSCDRPADLVEEFALPVPSLVICELLGVPYDDHEFFQVNSTKMISMLSTDADRAEATNALVGFLLELLDRKATEPGDDILSGLVPRVAAGEITADQAAKISMLLLFAGHETTANMIGLGTAALFDNPEQLALLRQTDDPAVVKGAVEELLRYLAITHNGIKRVAVEDIDVDGTLIRRGDGVLLPVEVGNRDPDLLERPDELDLTRSPSRHLAFSFGVHQCLGQQLARLELEVVYGTLYRRIPTLAPAVPVADLDYKVDSHVYGVRSLPVTW